VIRRAAAVLLIAAAAAATAHGGEQAAIYRASGHEAGLFDQYDNDGYSLAVVAGTDGDVELSVRVSDAPLESRAPFPTRIEREASLPKAPDRDAFAAHLAEGSRTEAQAVQRILLGLAAAVRYDPDRIRNQDPAAVFASRRAYCVGFAELAVDLLRRVEIPARTVQGILRTEPGTDRYDPAIGGAYHRWIEVYYPDRGYVFSDPWSSVNGVDARYVPFGRRSLVRPKSLSVIGVAPPEGALAYAPAYAGKRVITVRATAP
jgi:transglutaminase-like putative cysteine protease